MLRPSSLLGRRALATALALVAIVALATPLGFAAPVDPAEPADRLELWRGQSSPGSATIDFFVSGAQPGEQIFYTVTPDDSEEAARLAAANACPSIVADPGGFACIPISRELAKGGDGRPFFVFAFALRQDRGEGAAPRMIASSFALLSDTSALYMIVEVAESFARVLHFDPARGSIDEFPGFVDPGASLAIAGPTAYVASGNTLRSLDGRAAVDFGARVRPKSLATTPDQSAMLVLTREEIAAGRELLQVRAFDVPALSRELSPIDVLRVLPGVDGHADLVVGDDSHRMLVKQDGVIREVMLGAELTRGVTFLPLAPDGSDELIDVRVVDDLLVAVTRSRNLPESRLLLVDLRTRADPIEWKLPARAERGGLAVARSLGRLAAFVVVEGGAIEVIPLDPDGARATLGLAGAKRIEPSPHPGRLYVLAHDAASHRASVDLFDVDAFTFTPVALPPLSDQISHFGLIGSPDRHWLWFVEQQVRARAGGVRIVNRLWSCEVEPESGLLLDPELAAPHLLGGPVRRVAGQ